MRLGKVVINLKYVVDLDNDEMVQRAKDCLCKDVMSLIEYNDLVNAIDAVEDSSVKEDQIPSFLFDITKPIK